ncbi:hypothetical protein FZEAL_3711 [Fusarium zealandicum]|uniref:Uncharacterized protein n=1 Tax=Fusarium zealandicum TaxID=1053134 RepID=A0A8H4UNA2_9HYPO|nr:hypothetical protein FZEAL_3711 [Fusarium zealandicum]
MLDFNMAQCGVADCVNVSFKTIPNAFVSIFAALSSVARADWQYRSRPDLSPPRLNIPISASDDISPSLIFAAPFVSLLGAFNMPEQAGALIFLNNGDIV